MRAFLLPLALILLTGSDSVAQTHSALWGKNGEQWTPYSRLPDFSRAGYQRGERPLPQPAVTHNVKDFGAVGNGHTDDSEAFQRAIEAVDRGVILVPAGRYRLTSILRIEKPGLVLRGEDRDRTVLFFPTPLNDVEPNWGATTEGRRTSNYAWSGGFIWVRGSYGTERISPVTAEARRGDQVIQVASTRHLSIGQEVEVRQQDTAENTLADHLYSGDAGKTDELKGRTHASLVARIISIDGDRIRLDRPLRFDVKAEWRPGIYRYEPTVQEVGIENLTFEFPVTDYNGHFTELGFNPIAFQNVANSWVRNIRIRNADSGLFISGRFCTVQGVIFESERGQHGKGRITGHHGIYLSQDDNLFTGFDYQTRFQHDISVSHNAGNVISDGRGVDLSLDHHRRAPYENLFTNVDLGAGTRMYLSGGGRALGKHSAARATFWNIRADQPQTYPSEGFGPWSMNFIGVQSALPSHTDPDGKWFEAIPPEELYPQNLHRAQLSKRLEEHRPSTR